MKWFYHFDLSSCWRRAKRAGCGRVRSRQLCTGHVPIAVRKGRQRRRAVTGGEEQPEYLQRGGFILRGDVLSTSSSRWPIASRRARHRDTCLSRSYAACACDTKLRHGPPAALSGENRNIIWAINHHKLEVSVFACGLNLGVGLRRPWPCRGQTCGGMPLGLIARVAPPARPATL
jgi:hypothetical protein